MKSIFKFAKDGDSNKEKITCVGDCWINITKIYTLKSVLYEIIVWYSPYHDQKRLNLSIEKLSI